MSDKQGYDPEHPDPQHRITEDETENPEDLEAPEGTDPDPGEVPDEIRDAEPTDDDHPRGEN